MMFDRTVGHFSLYTSHEGDGPVVPRYILLRLGECPHRAVARFWKENPRTVGFSLVPLFSYGDVPRKELCTARSLSSALAHVDLEPGSETWMRWRQLAEHFNVTWPTRLRNAEKAA
jgi:hypothetical protein